MQLLFVDVNQLCIIAQFYYAEIVICFVFCIAVNVAV